MQIWAGKVLNFSLQSSKLFACKTHQGTKADDMYENGNKIGNMD